MITWFVATVFFLVSVAVAVLGFSSARSDVQIIIGIQGLLGAGVFLAFASLGEGVRLARRAIRKGQPPPYEGPPPPRRDAADNFNDAVRLYQEHYGHADPATSIRLLAAECLRLHGYLR